MRRYPVEVTVVARGMGDEYDARRLLREVVVTMAQDRDMARLCLSSGADVDLGEDEPVRWKVFGASPVPGNAPPDPYDIWTSRFIVALPDERPRLTLSHVANAWKEQVEADRVFMMFRCEVIDTDRTATS